MTDNLEMHDINRHKDIGLKIKFYILTNRLRANNQTFANFAEVREILFHPDLRWDRTDFKLKTSASLFLLGLLT